MTRKVDCRYRMPFLGHTNGSFWHHHLCQPLPLQFVIFSRPLITKWIRSKTCFCNSHGSMDHLSNHSWEYKGTPRHYTPECHPSQRRRGALRDYNQHCSGGPYKNLISRDLQNHPRKPAGVSYRYTTNMCLIVKTVGWYCWWFGNPARKPAYPIIYKVLAPSQGVIAGFLVATNSRIHAITLKKMPVK